jgi:flagellar hook-associated protein 3 FlgL
MQRVSTDLMNDDMQFWMRRRERDMASMEARMSSGTRLGNLRDDPLAAARTVRYDSSAARLQRYEKNALSAEDQAKVAEDYVRQAIDVAQRVREIAVQGANGVFTKEDQKYMAQEVDQLLGELSALANSRGPDGTYLFAGEKSKTEPFRIVEGAAPGAAGSVVVGLQYLGAPGGPSAEVSEGSYVPLALSGSDVFWAEKQQAISTFDARDWRAVSDSTFLVDGVAVQVKAGDNVYAVAAKINDSGAAVKATIDPRTFSLSLETTVAHQMRVEDSPPAGGGAGGATLKDLGLIAPTGSAPDNWAPSAKVSGGSLFDAVIRLRDSLNKGDILETGGGTLAGLDGGLENLSRRVAEIGSRAERLQIAAARLNKEIPDTVKLVSEESDVDMASAITDYRMLEYAHKASLGLAGRLFPQTLLDFLR